MKLQLSPERRDELLKEITTKKQDNIASMAVRLGAYALDDVPDDYVVIAETGPTNSIKAYDRTKDKHKLFFSGEVVKAIRFLKVKPNEKLIYNDRKLYGIKHG